ncbi:MAG: phospholipase effector Tle1 domain-containing protein, partial [Planctomycetaceae bacterium]
EPPAVRFLGLFDTVASFGIPWTDDDEFRKDIPEFVQHTFHAMALDETRETFGIERCVGNRARITEVWFRGGHGDIGGNGAYFDRHGKEQPNRQRSYITLNWMVTKARACGLDIAKSDSLTDAVPTNTEAQVTAKEGMLNFGNVGTLSRRIHIGDLVHHTVEDTLLTRGMDGRLLRRITVPVRIEDKHLERQADGLNWAPEPGINSGPDNVAATNSSPSLIHLSTRRYPFDVMPARTWRSWLQIWELSDLEKTVIDDERLTEFWSPHAADRAFAWDIYIELVTRITVQELKDHEGNSKTALESVYKLFPLSREGMKKYGVDCANAATLISIFLNTRIRWFTAKWHPLAEQINEGSNSCDPSKIAEFRAELRNKIQPDLRLLANALAILADARIQSF